MRKFFFKKDKKTKTLHDVLDWNGQKIPMTIVTEPRRSYRSAFTKAGVSIRVPSQLPASLRAKQINACKEWAIQVLNQKPNLANRFIRKTYQNGDVIQTFDQQFIIQIEFAQRKTIGIEVRGTIIYYTLPSELDASALEAKHISKALASYYQPFFQQRLNYWNTFFPVQHNQLRLKYNSSNWGSCSSKRNINLSTRLILCPIEVIDYVIVHELAHLVQQNHSKAFWQEVERVLPEYKTEVVWLKTKGAHLDF